MKNILIITVFLLTLTTQAKNLSVMSYNGENFFDIKHDQGTLDFTYLPLSVKRTLPGHKAACAEMTGFNKSQCEHLDWTEAKFNQKLVNFSRVVRGFDASGKGPDILVMQEIENANVLNHIATGALANLGYTQQVLIEGDDTRGIDVALISKYTVVSAKRHPIIFNGRKLDTRGILQVTLNVNGATVVVFVNHWPSQNNPAAERVASAQLLNSTAMKLKADLIIAMGDFNTLDTDSPYSLHYLTGFSDAETEARKLGISLKAGTSYHSGWTSLDRIFVFNNPRLEPVFPKFQIINFPFMLKTDHASGEQVPLRFDFQTGNGYSDHLPVGMEFSL